MQTEPVASQLTSIIMRIPRYDELTRPMLELLADGQAQHTRELARMLSDRFKLTEEERQALLPKGGQTYMVNRTGWAGFHLDRAGLVTRPKRATWQITAAGSEVLKAPAAKLDRAAFMKIPAFASFYRTSADNREMVKLDAAVLRGVEADAPPEEVIAGAVEVLHDALKEDVLGMVRRMDPIRFERLVLDLLLAMGYGGSREEAARMTKASNDEGIDGVINEDRLGLDVIYVQAKRWQNQVGRKEIQSFVGALAGQQAHKGIFITTSGFADTATEYARKVSQKVILIDGNRLAELMIEHEIGVGVAHVHKIKRVDSDFFEEG